MSAGLRVWDGQARLVFDATTRMSLALGSIALGDNHAAGSLAVPGFSQGTPYAIVISEQRFKGEGSVRRIPQAFVNPGSTVLQWDAGDACRIIYGVY